MLTGKINVLIVEDDSILALDLAMALEHDGYNIAGITDNSDEAIQLFSNCAVDIVLMDINICGSKDGIATAEQLLTIKSVPVIYLTGHSENSIVSKIKNTPAAAFLTKPYNTDNVRVAIELALHHAAKESAIKNPPINQIPGKIGTKPSSSVVEKEVILQIKDYVFIKQNFKFVRVALKDIIYAESDNNYIHLVTAARKYTLRISLQQWEDKIHYNRFARIHRSYLVNINSVLSFTETEVQLEEVELPISRNYRESFITNFNY